MTLLAYLAGSDEAHKIKIGDMGLSSRADGTGAFGGIIFDDPDGTLDIRGFMHVRVEEDDCTAAPVQLWGWIWVRSYKRGPYRDGPGRIIDCQVIDQNYAFNHQLITGLDGKRGAETDIERVDWLLGSAYVNGVVQDYGLVDRSTPHPMEDANYIGQYPAQVMEDLCGQLWKTWFVYVDQTEDALGLFYDTPPSTSSTSTLTLSNVLSDGSATCYYPFTDAEMERDPSEVYSKMRFVYRNGVVLGTNDTTQTTFFTDTGLGYRGVQVESTRVGVEATARARIQTLLARAAAEKDTITCSIWIEPASVGLIQAGQRLGIRFTHLPGYETLQYSRVTSRTVRQVRSDLYQMDLELSNAGVTAGAGGGGGDTGGFPNPPPSSPNLVQHKSTTAAVAIQLDQAPVDGDLLFAWAAGRHSGAPNAPTGFTLVDTCQVTDTFGGVYVGALFTRTASGDTGFYNVGLNDSVEIMEWNGAAFGTTQVDSDNNDANMTSGGAMTPTAANAVMVGCSVYGTFTAGNATITPASGVTELVDIPFNMMEEPHIWVGYKVVTTPALTTVGGTIVNLGAPGRNEWGGLSFTLYPTSTGNPPQPGQTVPWTVVVMSGAVGTTLFPYADGSLLVKVDGVLISTASYTETDPAAGTFTLSWVPDTDEVVTVQYQGR